MTRGPCGAGKRAGGQAGRRASEQATSVPGRVWARVCVWRGTDVGSAGRRRGESLGLGGATQHPGRLSVISGGKGVLCLDLVRLCVYVLLHLYAVRVQDRRWARRPAPSFFVAPWLELGITAVDTRTAGYVASSHQKQEITPECPGGDIRPPCHVASRVPGCGLAPPKYSRRAR
jgi:hypothetical protein